jgi:hypothetical protein
MLMPNWKKEEQCYIDAGEVTDVNPVRRFPAGIGPGKQTRPS